MTLFSQNITETLLDILFYYFILFMSADIALTWIACKRCPSLDNWYYKLNRKLGIVKVFIVKVGLGIFTVVDLLEGTGNVFHLTGPIFIHSGAVLQMAIRFTKKRREGGCR